MGSLSQDCGITHAVMTCMAATYTCDVLDPFRKTAEAAWIGDVIYNYHSLVEGKLKLWEGG